MKLDKFTKVCINLVLILAIALLLKYLIIAPRNLYSTNDGITTHQAQPTSAYKKASSKPDIFITITSPWDSEELQQTIDHAAKEGYKLHDIDIELPYYTSKKFVAILIFKR